MDKIQVEVCGTGRKPRELHAIEAYAEAPGTIPQPAEILAELPAELHVEGKRQELDVREDVLRKSGS